MRSKKTNWKDIAIMLMCFSGALLAAIIIGMNKLPPPGYISVPKDTVELRVDTVVGNKVIFRH